MLRRIASTLMINTLMVFSVSAEVPYIFTNGQPANASEVNANFAALSARIDQLETQLNAVQAFAGAPTTASLVGTYDIFMMKIDVEQNGPPGGYGVAGASSWGTLVLNVGGTGTLNQNNSYRQLALFDSLTNVGAPSNSGSVAIHSTSVQLNNTLDADNAALTWSLSGNIVTITTEVDGGEVTNYSIAGGKLLISGINNFEGQNGIFMLVRR